jgi:hypothetical protein
MNVMISIRCENIGERREGAFQRARALGLAPERRATEQLGVGNEPGGTVKPGKRRRGGVDRRPCAGR